MMVLLIKSLENQKRMIPNNLILCLDCEVFIELDNENPRWRREYQTARRNNFLLNHKDHNLKYENNGYQEVIEDGRI